MHFINANIFLKPCLTVSHFKLLAETPITYITELECIVEVVCMSLYLQVYP